MGMGFSRKRTGRGGKPRYTAYYLDTRGRERSAGSFGRKKDAEGAIRAGRRGDPSRGKRLFETYVLQEWLPYH